MTTENVTRPIRVLMEMDTYSEMTDAEIDSLISYKESLAYAKGRSDVIAAKSLEVIEEHRRRSIETDNMLRDVIESIHEQRDKLFGEVNS